MSSFGMDSFPVLHNSPQIDPSDSKSPYLVPISCRVDLDGRSAPVCWTTHPPKDVSCSSFPLLRKQSGHSTGLNVFVWMSVCVSLAQMPKNALVAAWVVLEETAKLFSRVVVQGVSGPVSSKPHQYLILSLFFILAALMSLPSAFFSRLVASKHLFNVLICHLWWNVYSCL